MTLTPARIAFDAEGLPHAPDFGDRYHPRAGAALQAREVFLAGNGLPGRWAGRSDFSMLETGFGLGNNFLATWQAWRDDPQRPTRLHYVAIEGHPPSADDLRRCHAGTPWPELAAALQRAWPPLTPGLHPIDFDGGRVQLLLALGEVGAVARALDLAADALYLDGFAPDRNPAMWSPALLQTLARRLAPGATAATWTVARSVRDGLRAAGFELTRVPGPADKRETLRARLAPTFALRAPAPRGAAPGVPAEAVVVGAGLAGAWAARALVRQGWRVSVLERHAAPAQEASGNPGGLFHPSVMADEGTHAGFNRAAALRAWRWLAPAIGQGALPGLADGLLQLAAHGTAFAAMQATAARLGLPAAYAQALDRAAASACAGTALDRPAWFFPQGGWVAPGALVRHLLAAPGIDLRTGIEVAALRRDGAHWQLLDGSGHALATTATLVLANATEAARLWPHAGWPLGRSRGQLSWWQPPPAGAPRLRLPLAGEGYALALPGGDADDDPGAAGALLCGATAAPGDEDPALRAADHDFNRERLARLTGWQAPPPDAGRVGWRVTTPDRLPIVGPVPSAALPTPTAPPLRLRDQVREPGLFVLTALGSRGLSWGPLAAEVLAAWISGAPMPVEGRLRDALDPARWQVRAARRGLAPR